MGLYASKEELRDVDEQPLSTYNRFSIMNHLLKTIDVIITLSDGSSWALDDVVPDETRSIPIPTLKEGDRINVSIDGRLFNLYEVKDKPVSSLHIGQITTRFEQDGGHFRVNSLQGRASVKIFNLSKKELRINENIRVAPRTTFTYRGRHNMGIPLGLKLSDKEGLYPTLVIDKPVTAIYYGITTDKHVPFYGGYEISLSDNPLNDQVYHFEDGIM